MPCQNQMSSSVFTLAVLRAYLDRYGLSGKMHNGVYDGKVVLNIDQNGFKSITSGMTMEKMTFKSSLVLNGLRLSKNRVLGMLNGDCSGYKSEVENFFQDIIDFESVSYEKATRDVFNVFYSKETGKLTFLSITFEPNFKDDTVTYRLIKVEVKMQLPGIFIIGTSAKGNLFGAKMSQSLQRIESSLTLNHVVDAIVCALAPAMIGLVDLPPEFINKMINLAQQQL